MSKEMEKRSIELLILSDIHLGTYGCKAKELNKYLKSIEPKEVILNGDIIDIWQFKKRYWPKSHMKVLVKIFKWISNGVKVTYITGNHDEMLRKFEGFKIGSFQIQNKMVLELDNQKAWVFHGDVFDVTMQHSKWIVKLGAIGYNLLTLINAIVNHVSHFFGKGRISLSKKVKNSVKSAVKYINQFESTVVNIAAKNGYDYVICGHIHQPVIKTLITEDVPIKYLNSGDWVENLSALEYNDREWSLYMYNENDFLESKDEANLLAELLLEDCQDLEILLEKSNRELFNEMQQSMEKTHEI